MNRTTEESIYPEGSIGREVDRIRREFLESLEKIEKILASRKIGIEDDASLLDMELRTRPVPRLVCTCTHTIGSRAHCVVHAGPWLELFIGEWGEWLEAVRREVMGLEKDVSNILSGASMSQSQRVQRGFSGILSRIDEALRSQETLGEAGEPDLKTILAQLEACHTIFQEEFVGEFSRVGPAFEVMKGIQGYIRRRLGLIPRHPSESLDPLNPKLFPPRM